MPAQHKGRVLWLTLGLTGCTPGCDGEIAPEDTGDPLTDDIIQDDEWTDDCASRIKGTPFPLDGQQDVYPGTTFVVEFVSDESSTASFELRDTDGAAVPLGPLTWSDDGTAVYLAPAERLAPARGYVLDVSFSCDGQREIAFTTSDVGVAVDVDEVVASAFALDLAHFVVAEPPGVNSLLDPLLDEIGAVLILAPRRADVDVEVELVMGVVDTDGTQDTCTRTAVLPAPVSLEENPFFEVEAPAGFALEVSGVDVLFESFSLSGAFTADGAAMVGLELAAVLDTRSLDSLAADLGGDEGAAGAICDLFAQFPGQGLCEPCRDGERLCLPVFAIDGVALLWDDPFVEVSDSDAAVCETDPPAP